MTIAFDSNVWRILASPDVFPNEPSINEFRKIRQAIIDGKVLPFISETVFTIESIRKKDRKSVLGSSNAKVEIKEKEADDGMIGISISIGPKSALDFDDNPILKRHFDDAIALGFKIARLPRIAGLFNKEVDDVRYLHKEDDLEAFHDRVFQVAYKIENAGAGRSHIVAIGNQFDKQWIEGIRKAPDSETGNISKAAAEWADGDSVAICLALGCDYFCTRDQAKSAGSNSVLSIDNLKWLEKDYGLKIISPENLSALLD